MFAPVVMAIVDVYDRVSWLWLWLWIIVLSHRSAIQEVGE